jgi:hypothetical protein
MALEPSSSLNMPFDCMVSKIISSMPATWTVDSWSIMSVPAENIVDNSASLLAYSVLFAKLDKLTLNLS